MSLNVVVKSMFIHLSWHVKSRILRLTFPSLLGVKVDGMVFRKKCRKPYISRKKNMVSCRCPLKPIKRSCFPCDTCPPIRRTSAERSQLPRRRACRRPAECWGSPAAPGYPPGFTHQKRWRKVGHLDGWKPSALAITSWKCSCYFMENLQGNRWIVPTSIGFSSEFWLKPSLKACLFNRPFFKKNASPICQWFQMRWAMRAIEAIVSTTRNHSRWIWNMSSQIPKRLQPIWWSGTSTLMLVGEMHF